MHRISSWVFLVAALYVSSCAFATDTPLLPAADARAPHIALLLPLKSELFGEAAKMVEQGFFAAANSQPHTLPIRIYSSFDESKDITALYRAALADGAQAVVGPLTRDGVRALAAMPSISVPTLALNVSEAHGENNLFFFGLSAEAEARQIAQLAAAAALQSATIISTDTPLSRRVSDAFAAEWVVLGRKPPSEIIYAGDPAPLSSIPVKDGHMVFLATNAATARLARPYLDIALPVYATSQVFNGNADTLTNFDLNDVRFVDMPWLLEPDHPAVMIYPRLDPAPTPDMERLYALGIDAFRLLQIILTGNTASALPLDGVTGRIDLSGRQQFQREAEPALFKQGRGFTPEQLAAMAAEQAAAKAGSAVPATATTSTP
ncbi:MAG: penicillin-binding protein activator [Gallionellaceae bacterium]